MGEVPLPVLVLLQLLGSAGGDPDWVQRRIDAATWAQRLGDDAERAGPRLEALFPELEESPDRPVYIVSAQLSMYDFATRVRFSNGVEVWLGPAVLDMAEELEEMAATKQRVTHAFIATLAVSPYRIVSTSGPRGTFQAPPIAIDIDVVG